MHKVCLSFADIAHILTSPSQASLQYNNTFSTFSTNFNSDNEHNGLPSSRAVLCHRRQA